MKDIAYRIKQLRAQSGMTQEQLAEKLHVTRQAVSNWETKKNRPDIETLEAAAEVFSIDLMQLLYGSSKKKPEKSVVIQAVIFAAASVSAVILYFLVIPAAVKSDRYNYDFTAVYILTFAVNLLSGCFLPFVFSIISLWADIKLRRRNIKILCLTAGAAAAVLFLIFWIFVVCIPGSASLPGNWITVLLSLGTKFYMPVISGGFFWFGLKKTARNAV